MKRTTTETIYDLLVEIDRIIVREEYLLRKERHTVAADAWRELGGKVSVLADKALDLPRVT